MVSLSNVSPIDKHSSGPAPQAPQAGVPGGARGLMSSGQEAEDVVQEAFVKAFSAIRNGHGPTDVFVAYLNTSIRSVANTFWKKFGREQPAADEELNIDPEEDPRLETALAVFEHERIAVAMKSLPERWRTVLWHCEVLGHRPREVAPLMGLEPNAVSALLIQARQGLRRAYDKPTGTCEKPPGKDSSPSSQDAGRQEARSSEAS